VSAFGKAFRLQNLDFGVQSSTPATVDLLAAFVGFLRPRVIVESGTHQGTTALTLAATLEHHGLYDSHIWTAEVDDNIDIRYRLEGHGLQDFITLYHGDFMEMYEEVPKPIDFAYIDGGDRLPQVETVLSDLSPRGLIFVDDTRKYDWPGAVEIYKMADLRLDSERGISIITSKNGFYL